jgi:succinate dehydrogenase / fumarate reductase flavoprotein subunit
MSESARGEGGRVWVPRKQGDDRDPKTIPEDERWYFLEERYPKYGNLVPRDIATREIFWVCQEGHGVGGGRMVYLDVSHLSDAIKNKLAGILEIYEKFTGEDPRKGPMKIFPAVHYSMGGLYTSYTPKEDSKGLVKGAPGNMMTNVKGLYAFGEVNYQYHGGTRLGANALLNCIFDGIFNGLSVANYVRDEAAPVSQSPESLYQSVVDAEQAKVDRLIRSDGPENAYHIHRELGDELTDACTVIREEQRMLQAHEKLQQLKARYEKVRLTDTGMWTNQYLSYTRALGDMLLYGELILEAAIRRKESRGSHYRPDYPERNDEEFLRTTLVKFDPAARKHLIEYEEVPQPLVPPRARTYGKVEASAADKEAENANTPEKNGVPAPAASGPK